MTRTPPENDRDAERADPAALVTIERDQEVAIVRLNRPPANAIDLAMTRAVSTVLDDLMATSPAAIVLTGTDRCFSAGLDLKTVPRYTREQQQTLITLLNRMITRLYACPTPLVGAINGHAIAGGFILALTPDYRVGPQGDALFGLTEARVGIPFPAAPMIVLQAELAPAHVRLVTLQARTFGASDALARGVFDELRPPGEVLARACEVARDMATIPSDAFSRIKRQVRAEGIARLEELEAAGSDPMLEHWFGDEAAGAAAAVLGGIARRR